MSAFFHRPHASSNNLPGRRQSTAFRAGMVAFLACCLAALPGGLPAAVNNNQGPAPLTTDDGFTRETLSEFDAPEPAPFAPAPAAAVEDAADAPQAESAARHHHRVQPRHRGGRSQPQTVVVKVPAHRGPVVRFVYWWNGWVIRNFHTKFGTVLLGTIGSEGVGPARTSNNAPPAKSG